MKFVKEFIVPAAVLTIICVVVSAALVLTNDVTKPIIEAAKIAEADAARVEVLAGAKGFEKVTVSVPGITEAYKASNGAGYVFTSETKGYGGSMFVMTGITAEGTVEKVKLMTNQETQGIGSAVGEDKYTGQYVGKDIKLEGVNAISGATISSGAFKSGVEAAFQAYAELAGVEIEAVPFEKMAFPSAENFEEITLEGALKAFNADDKGVVIVTEAQGYSGAATKMQVYTGIDNEGKIVGVALGENTETKGLGSKVGEEAHTSQFIGKTNTDGIEAVSAATESSDGFKAAVNKALELFAAKTGA